MPSGKRETERNGNPAVNVGSSPFFDERANSAAEEVNEPARGSGSLQLHHHVKAVVNFLLHDHSPPAILSFAGLKNQTMTFSPSSSLNTGVLLINHVLSLHILNNKMTQEAVPHIIMLLFHQPSMKSRDGKND
ncbi:hypothetical protein T11_16649 [Trichinella zimbabwensis]|uniref:Uncharacterized protein n=1 Tax=Trichinella zimbabwensis TaxID=268475 RepID=A0A0V1HTM4_9BILA|nr:hypothetical protein T11_16649 [Trichinella zimbabwensis]